MDGDFKNLFGEEWHPNEFDEEARKKPENSEGPGAEFPLPDFTTELENRTPRSLNEKAVEVKGVYMQQQEGGVQPQHFVVLRDNRGRKVPIFVGQNEAFAILFAINDDKEDKDNKDDRPMTHDLMKIMLDRLGITIDRVVIDDLWQDTFYSKITLVKPNGEYIEIDSRPSDALALALRMKAPVYMAETVIEATVKQE